MHICNLYKIQRTPMSLSHLRFRVKELSSIYNDRTLTIGVHNNMKYSLVLLLVVSLTAFKQTDGRPNSISGK